MKFDYTRDVIAVQPDQANIVWEDGFVSDPDRIIKIGIHKVTIKTDGDATKRHSIKYFKQIYDDFLLGIEKEPYRGLPFEIGYTVRTLHSCVFPTWEEASKFEKYILASIKPNVRLSSQWNGASECRYATNKKILELRDRLRQIMPNFGQPETGYKIYFQVLDKRPKMKPIPNFIFEGGRYQPHLLEVLSSSQYQLREWEKLRSLFTIAN